jgi:Cu2+-exporting ATPase
VCARLCCLHTPTLPPQVRAASDLKALARLIPADARLVLDPTGAQPAAASDSSSGGDSSSSDEVEYALVATSTVRPGDILRVLPGALGVAC